MYKHTFYYLSGNKKYPEIYILHNQQWAGSFHLLVIGKANIRGLRFDKAILIDVLFFKV